MMAFVAGSRTCSASQGSRPGTWAGRTPCWGSPRWRPPGCRGSAAASSRDHTGADVRHGLRSGCGCAAVPSSGSSLVIAHVRLDRGQQVVQHCLGPDGARSGVGGIAQHGRAPRAASVHVGDDLPVPLVGDLQQRREPVAVDSVADHGDRQHWILGVAVRARLGRAVRGFGQAPLLPEQREVDRGQRRADRLRLDVGQVQGPAPPRRDSSGRARQRTLRAPRRCKWERGRPARWPRARWTPTASGPCARAWTAAWPRAPCPRPRPWSPRRAGRRPR